MSDGPHSSAVPGSQSSKDRAPGRASGWLIECPQCGHCWKVSREEIGTGRWQICSDCVDTTGWKTG